MIDRPNVTSSGASGPVRSARSNRASWSTAPAAKASGSISSSATPERHPERGHHRGDQVGAAHGQVAVGQVDQPHHAEHERQPDRGQRVRAAEKIPCRASLSQVTAAPPGPAGTAAPGGSLRSRRKAHRSRRRPAGRDPGRAPRPAPTRPSSRQSARSLAARARSMSCSTSRMAHPGRLDARQQSGRSSSTTAGARPSDTSSSSSTRGFAASARAIATACCSPPDSRPRPLRAARRDHRETGRTARPGVHGPAAAPRPPGTRMFSSAVRLGNSRRPSGTSAMPRPGPLVVGAAR